MSELIDDCKSAGLSLEDVLEMAETLYKGE